MKATDLIPFCSDHKAPLLEPFSRAEHTYATDGRILIRVPRIDGVGEECGIDLNGINQAATIEGREPFKIDDITEWVAVNELPGTQFRAVCDRCAENYDYSIEDDCPSCKGTGVVNRWREKFEAYSVGNRYLNPYYVRLISALPNAAISTQIGTNESPVYIRFDGGVGLLMPARSVREDQPIADLAEVLSATEPKQTPTEAK